MAASALEAKINKIRLQNEEIKRRYQEVEEDKKNAAKLNALVQMVPSSDWPERKEPPEFSNPPKSLHKPKAAKEKTYEYHSSDGKKGEGPPPDPKYNFLADSEREETGVGYIKENTGNKIYNRVSRGSFRKKGPGREGGHKDGKSYRAGGHRDEHQPEYDAWRAERNRIDEDRISRQRTAEGNWRREWDNDKMHVVDETIKTEARATLGDFAKKDYKDFDRRAHNNGSDHSNYNRGGNTRSYRGGLKNFHNNYDARTNNTYDHHRFNSSTPVKTPLSLNTPEERTVIATDKSIKVMLNQGNSTKGTMMSVKVNSPSIAGTGRVGPRQRTRVTYSHSDIEMNAPNVATFSRQKSFEDKGKATCFNNIQKSPNVKRSQSQKKKENVLKLGYSQGKEDNQHYETDLKVSSLRKDNRELQKAYYPSKSPKLGRKNVKQIQSNSLDASEKEEHNQAIPDDADIKGSMKDDVQVQDPAKDIDAPVTLEKNNVQCNDPISVCQEPVVTEQEEHLVSNKDTITQEITTSTEQNEKDGEPETINSIVQENLAIPVTVDTDTVGQLANSDVKDENNGKEVTKESKEDPNNVMEDTASTGESMTDPGQQQKDTTLVDAQNKVEKAIESANPLNEDKQEAQSPRQAIESSAIDNCDKIADPNIHEKAIEESKEVEILSTENSEQCGNTDNPEAMSITETCSVIPTKDANAAIEINVLTEDESNVTQCGTQDSHNSNGPEPGECDSAIKNLPSETESQADDNANAKNADAKKEDGKEASSVVESSK